MVVLIEWDGSYAVGAHVNVPDVKGDISGDIGEFKVTIACW